MPVSGFDEGQHVWVMEPDGSTRAGVYVGDNESAGFFGGMPSAYVAFPDTHEAQVVGFERISPREED